MDEARTLRLAREVIQQGDKVAAQKHLLQAIEANSRSEIAWLWLSAIVDDPARERECLERVIAINPNNTVAQQHLQELERQEPAVRPPIPPDQTQPTASPSHTSTSTPPSTLELYGAGLVLPCISPTFYFYAARRRVAGTVGFFLLFALVITTVQALGIFQDFGTEVEGAFTSGRFPEITISRGKATIHGTEPFVRELGDGILILDTTGQYTASYLRSGRYRSGILLTRTTLYNLDDGEVQHVALSELQPMLGEPFVLDTKTVQTLLSWLQLMIYIGLIIWNAVVRLAYLGLVALPVWGVATALRPGTGYAPVLITGIYALGPTIYGSYLLKRAGIAFCGLQTMLLLVVWAIGLVAALSERKGGIISGERTLRGWRALIGMPMLLVLMLDAIFSSIGPLVTWMVTLLTLVILAFIGLWPILGSETEQELENEFSG